MTNSALRRTHQIDGLRAVAVGLVVFHHSLNSALITVLDYAGFDFAARYVRFLFGSGVELFFVISGIVLLRPYLRDGQSFSRQAATRYYRRRVARLWPPYLAALAVAGLVILAATAAPTWYTREVLPQFSVGDWLSQIFIFNLGGPTYNAAWWSLPVEIALYVVLPLFIPLMRGAKPLVWQLAAWAATMVLAELAHGGAINLAPAGLASAPGRVLEVGNTFLVYLPCFFAGVLVARNDFERRSGYGAVAAGLLWTIAAVASGSNPHSGFALLYFGVVVVALDARTNLASWLQSYPMVWIGERSYSLFLLHFTMFYLVNDLISMVIGERNLAYFLATRSLGLGAAMLAAMALFHMVERRFARGLVTANAFWPARRTIASAPA
jgi:peptidoglycan/LPS O-acetylase OafA/YrhL